jgi:hypothetical protein
MEMLQDKIRTAQEGYEHGYKAGLRMGALQGRERRAVERAKGQAIVGWLLLACAFLFYVAVLVTVMFTELGTQ